MTSEQIPYHKSRQIIISDHDPRWRSEYEVIATRVRAAAGNLLIRIDHIGSTSVPDLGAKDVVDIQVTVADLHNCEPLLTSLRGIGYTRGDVVEFDSLAMLPAGDMQLAKRYMREPSGARRTHVHIRQAGHLNQRMALLFRDYLRAAPSVRAQYETVKRRAALIFPENIDGYIWTKDAPIQIIHEAAMLWAATVAWTPA